MSRQDGKCAHCGTIFNGSILAERPELDHKISLLNAGKGDTTHTLENTWLLCGTCHQAKSCIENNTNRHRLTKHRSKIVWLSRSFDGEWHLRDLQQQADFVCGRSCLKCRLLTASYLMNPRQLSYTSTLSGGVYFDALRFYELIGDGRWVKKIKLMLAARTGNMP